ncbi:hypothetical protein [Piscirickettsia salmonis]|uniref:hypothetical protein n=1 Tax=Piscirickettsia salmonis TaxID=1238 RepID=UPI0031F50B6D
MTVVIEQRVQAQRIQQNQSVLMVSRILLRLLQAKGLVKSTTALNLALALPG